MSEVKKINPIEAMQTIVSTMQDIESYYSESLKELKELNEQQNDLLHTIEEDIEEDEILAVGKALKKLRNERRAVKDLLINLSEAKNFVVNNKGFTNKASELVERMGSTEKKYSTRKYYIRNCEAIKEVLDISKYTDKIATNEVIEPVEVECKPKPKEEPRLSAVEKFNKKWGFDKK